jgi:hypothetical protein
MRWCCAGFQAACQAAGERSIAVLIDEDDQGNPEFFLQARAFDAGTEPELNVATPMSLVIQKGLQFCPWCGTRLQQWYRRHARELKRPALRIDRK